MQASNYSYEPYNEKFIILYGDKQYFESIVKTLGGKWRAKINAFLIPKNNEDRVKSLLLSLTNDEKLKNMSTKFKSRHDQRKYHREKSDDEYSSSSDEEDLITLPRQPSPRKRVVRNTKRSLKNVKREKSKTLKDKRDSKTPSKRSRRRLRKEKIFVPKDILLASESSNTEDESSSDSDFPEAEDPRDIEKEHKLHLSRMRRMRRRDKILKK